MKKKKTKLINKSDIMKIIHMRGPIGWLLATLSMWIFGFNKVNKANERCEQYKGAEFSSHILKCAGIKLDLKPQQYNNIPQDGPFIVVANHPIGSADGMMLSAVVGTMRTDFKILANFLLSLIPSLRIRSFPSIPSPKGPCPDAAAWPGSVRPRPIWRRAAAWACSLQGKCPPTSATTTGVRSNAM